MSTQPNDELDYDVGLGEQEAEVTLESTEESTEGTENTETAAEQAQAPESERSELDQVSEAVQKRIAKLTARMRESERREQAALDYAKGLQTQTQELQQRLVHTDFGRLSETKQRLETQQGTLKAIIRKAREEGDVDTEMEAQQRLSDLGQQHREVSSYLNQQQAQRERPQQEAQQQPVQQQQPKRAVPSPKAEQWAANNAWFGQDRILTYGAWGIHQTLVDQEGVDPESDEYYTELDKRLREEFPKRFQAETPPAQQNRQQRPAPAVAPATRSSGVQNVRRTVRLSPSQVAIAKKLGVPIEEYAKYVKE